MDSKSNSSVVESGDLSPKSTTTTPTTNTITTEMDSITTTDQPQQLPPQPPVPGKVKLMVSYGGRIQPRATDQQLSYVNGETKILSLDRTVRFAEFYGKLVALAGMEDLCVKYQLPGEDLDSLVSVTNDEDVEHLIHEYDRLPLTRPVSTSTKPTSPTARLRVFLFTINPPLPPHPAALFEASKSANGDRQWFLDSLNSVPNSPAPRPETLTVTAAAAEKTSPGLAPAPTKPEPISVAVSANPTAPTSPDYLFGLDNGFVPPPAVKVKDPAGEPPTARENVPVEIKEDKTPPPQINGGNVISVPVNCNGNGNGNGSEHVSPVMSQSELQRRQIQEFEKLQMAAATDTTTNNNNGNTTTTPPEFFLPKFPEKSPVPPATGPTGFLPGQENVVAGRFASFVGDNHGGQYYFIHTAPGVYPPTQGYYQGPPGGASYPTVYAVGPPPVPTKVVKPQQPQQQVTDGNTNAAAKSYAPPQVAGFDSTGRPLYYASMLPPPYAPVSGVPLSTLDAAKPVVKPAVP